MVRPFSIGRHAIGERCFIIAEAGVNHHGDIAQGLQLVDAAVEAGADAVKFQTFNPALLVHRSAAKGEYQKRTTGPAESQRQMLEKLALGPDDFCALNNRCDERGIVFLSTPFDEESVDILDQLGVAAFKLSSAEITNLPFIRRVAGRGKPVILSSGMSEISEIDAAVRAAHGAPVALLHCVSAYPTPVAECNLRVIPALRERYGIPVGFSDHTKGLHVAPAAVALGAVVVEKHLTLDRNLPGPDHAASITPGEFRDLVAGIRDVESALGDGIKRVAASERENLTVARRSLFWARSLQPGSLAGPADLLALRPGTGISPSRLDEFIGIRLARSVNEGELVSEEDFVRP